MTTTNEIITSKGPIQFLANTIDISPSVVEAQEAISSKKIPPHAIRQRPARGGQLLSYVDHVYVTEVIPGGPADIAGMRKGDLIVEYNGNPAKDPQEFVRRISLMPVGSEVSLVVLRGETRSPFTLRTVRRR